MIFERRVFDKTLRFFCLIGRISVLKFVEVDKNVYDWNFLERRFLAKTTYFHTVNCESIRKMPYLACFSKKVPDNHNRMWYNTDVRQVSQN